VKLVLPLGPLTGAVGLAVTVNKAASVPLIVMPSPVRLALPVFFIVKVRLVLASTTTLLKSLLPPSAMLAATGCSTVISGAIPLPVRLISKGFSSFSLLAMCNAAVLASPYTALYRSVQLVLPLGPLTGAVGLAVTVNNAASVPLIVIPSPVRSALPVF